MLLSRQCRPSPIPRLWEQPGTSTGAHPSCSCCSSSLPPWPGDTAPSWLITPCHHQGLWMLWAAQFCPGLCSPNQGKQTRGTAGALCPQGSPPSQLLLPCALLPSRIQASPCQHTWHLGQRAERTGLSSEPQHIPSSGSAWSIPWDSEASTQLWSRGWEALPPSRNCFPAIPQRGRAAATDGSAAQQGCGDNGERTRS